MLALIESNTGKKLIKFDETRNYVQRVLENYNVYRYILEKKTNNNEKLF